MARMEGLSDLRGTDMIWSGAIIADKAQERRKHYPGRFWVRVFNTDF
jgi:hypothetical protein